jgi:hypothetical protein
MDFLATNEYIQYIILIVLVCFAYYYLILPCLRIIEHYNSKCCPDDYPNLIFDWKNIPTCYSKRNFGTDPKPDCLPPNFLKIPFTTSISLDELRKNMPQMPVDDRYVKRKPKVVKPIVISIPKELSKVIAKTIAKTTTPVTSTAKTTTPATSTAKTTTPVTSTAKTTTPATSTAKTITPTTSTPATSTVKTTTVTSTAKTITPTTSTPIAITTSATTVSKG